MKHKLVYITLLSVLLLSACGKDNDMEPFTDDRAVEFFFHVNDFIRDGVSVRSTDNGSTAEQGVTDLYILMFREGTEQLIGKYYIADATVDGTFTGGSYDLSDSKVALNMTQAEAGKCEVYVVANVNANGLLTALNNIMMTNPTALTALKAVFKETAQPWSTNIAAPILMTGKATHDFTVNYQLNSVRLIRAVAKIELNVKLTSGFQVVPTISSGNLAEYRYRYVNFDTRTYVEKPATKPANLTSSSTDTWPNTGNWTHWGALLNGATPTDAGTGYTLSGGKVTELRLITYLNERDETGATVEIVLPRVDVGPLPPPEFGPELYRLPMPDKIVRNTWYKYDIEI